MSITRLYIALERLDMTDALWAELVSDTQGKGANNNPNACNRNHWRYSLDGSKIILEALFDSSQIDAGWYRAWMVSHYGGPPESAIQTFDQYGKHVTHIKTSNRFIMRTFGYFTENDWPDYATSHEAVLEFLKNNLAEWEIEEQ